jgi:hypothetical protein
MGRALPKTLRRVTGFPPEPPCRGWRERHGKKSSDNQHIRWMEAAWRALVDEQDWLTEPADSAAANVIRSGNIR